MAVHVLPSTLFQPPTLHLPLHHLSTSNCSIMRKNPYSKPSFVLPSKRRRLDAGPALTKPSRPGFIDQKLIEGSQQPRSSSSIPHESSPSAEALPSLHDEEPQFDAFGELQSSDHGLMVLTEYQTLSCWHRRVKSDLYMQGGLTLFK